MTIDDMCKISAIIPAYNEEPTIGQVVETVKKSSLIDELIVVSDGSKDKTCEVAEKNGAKCLDLKKNVGKGEAMAKGVAATDAPIIVFFDADLRGLTPKHVEQLVAPVQKGEVDMTVGQRDRGPLMYKFYRLTPLIGGERAMKRQVFETIPKPYRQRFMVEQAMNYNCRINGWKIGRVNLLGLTMRKKMEKVGIYKGFWEYVKMFWQVFKAAIIVRWAHVLGRF